MTDTVETETLQEADDLTRAQRQQDVIRDLFGIPEDAENIRLVVAMKMQDGSGQVMEGHATWGPWGPVSEIVGCMHLAMDRLIREAHGRPEPVGDGDD